jgi:hypothetical protein
MLSRITRILAVPALLAATLSASSAFALIDAEALVGRRWYTLGTDPASKISSQEVAVAAHLDPIPLIPISFGARVGMGTLNEGQVKSAFGASSIETATVAEAGLDVMAWIPLVPIITPYVRLNIPVYGVWAVKGKVNTLLVSDVPLVREAKLSGTQLSIGAKYSVLPLVKVLFEANYGKETWKPSEYTIAGQTITSDTKSYTLNSQAVFLGLEVGF